jgi:predicted CXXCH cytochrome family protein
VVLLWVAGGGLSPVMALPQGGGQSAATATSSCILCHGESELWEGERRSLHVTAGDLSEDVHWELGLRCHDCHGGDPDSTDFVKAHATESGFQPLLSPVDEPAFCGRCHSDIGYMRRFQPSPRTDQESEYWTSGHGQRLREHGDTEVATCVSCHGRHGIRRVDDPQAPVFPTQIAKTCATCHSNAGLMAGRVYEGKPVGHDQYDLWSNSVHATALLENGDLSAATCNDCHGNHGAVPPETTSVANACGTCHVKVANLFAETQMKHRFEELDMPGCTTCHGNHEIATPTDDMLGMQSGALCADCHQNAKYGATFAGAEVAKMLSQKLGELKRQISESEEIIAEAERLGMEVRGPKFDIREAETALTNARTLVHSFAEEPMNETLDKGLEVVADVRARAEQALGQYTYRRVWLAASTLPILLVVGILLLYIRVLPNPLATPEADAAATSA